MKMKKYYFVQLQIGIPNRNHTVLTGYPQNSGLRPLYHFLGLCCTICCVSLVRMCMTCLYQIFFSHFEVHFR